MAVMIIRHKVKDFASWKTAYDAHKVARDGAGLSNARACSVRPTMRARSSYSSTLLTSAKPASALVESQLVMKGAGVVDKPGMRNSGTLRIDAQQPTPGHGTGPLELSSGRVSAAPILEWERTWIACGATHGFRMQRGGAVRR